MPKLILPAGLVDEKPDHDVTTKDGYEASMKEAEKHISKEHLSAFRRDVKKASKKVFG